jgi:hypothetical protein
MMKDPSHSKEDAPEHGRGQGKEFARPSGQERQEQFQQIRDQAVSGLEHQDREARIRRRAHEIWEQEGRPEGFAEKHWSRAVHDVERKDEEAPDERRQAERTASDPE